MKRLLVVLLTFGLLSLNACSMMSVVESVRAVNRFKGGDYQGAIELQREAVKRIEELYGPNHESLPIYLSNLANYQSALGQYTEAEESCLRAVRILKANDQQKSKTSFYVLNTLGQVYVHQNKRERAITAFQEALSIANEEYGEDEKEPAIINANLGALYTYSGRLDEAEAILKKALRALENDAGTTSPYVAIAFNNLGLVYQEQRRLNESNKMFRRSLDLINKRLGPKHPQAAYAHSGLCGSLTYQSNYRAAKPHCQSAHDLFVSTHGPDHPNVGVALHNLGWIALREGDHDTADKLLNQALEKKTKGLGERHKLSAETLMTIGQLHHRRGDNEKAIEYTQRTIDILYDEAGPYHPRYAIAVSDMGALLRKQGKYKQALPYLREATDIMMQRGIEGSKRRSQGSLTEQRSVIDQYREHLEALSRLYLDGKQPRSDREVYLIEAFLVGQFAHIGRASAAVANMAARFGANNDKLAEAIKQRQDTVERWERLERSLVDSLSKPSKQRNRRGEKKLRAEIKALDTQIKDFDKQLQTRFPEYADLVSSQPIEPIELHPLLKPDEALLAYFISRNNSYIFILRHNDIGFGNLAIRKDDVDSLVSDLRDNLDPLQLEELSDIRHLDVEKAHDLYTKIVAPSEMMLKGVKHIMVVPHGPLESLPFSVMVTDKPKGPIRDFGDYKDVAWLGKKYAITTLPSLSSLRALRTFAQRSKSSKQFLGVGNPVLEGSPGTSRGVQLAKLFARGSVADVNEVRRLPPLPDTEDELNNLAQAIGSGDRALLTRGQATETKLRELDLSQYRVLAFATHGLMAGDFQTLAEPALVLTPPKRGSTQDDGLLTASEIAQLNLNADWIILSACNTAAPDGTPGAGGFSGLTRAFFYAGSRSLLVSHWSVVSDATVELTSQMFRRLAENPNLRRAEALRQASFAVMNNSEKPYFAHPMFWAPFVVVGEGGTT